MIRQYQAPFHHVVSEKFGHMWILWANSGFQCFRQQSRKVIEQCHVLRTTYKPARSVTPAGVCWSRWALKKQLGLGSKVCNKNHKVRHRRCVYNKLDWSLYTCLTQLYGGTDMYNLLHKELHVSALFIGHLQVDKWETLISSYTRLVWVVYSGEVMGGVGTRSRMCCVGRVLWLHGFCYILF